LGFGHEQRIVLGQRGDKSGIDGEIVFRPVTGAAGTAAAVEGLIEKDLAPFGDQLLLGTKLGRRRLASGQQEQLNTMPMWGNVPHGF